MHPTTTLKLPVLVLVLPANQALVDVDEVVVLPEEVLGDRRKLEQTATAQAPKQQPREVARQRRTGCKRPSSRLKRTTACLASRLSVR
jgi:hypothetical protein